MKTHELTSLFENVGDCMLRLWAQCNYEADAFPAIAYEEFERHCLHKAVKPQDILSLAIANPTSSSCGQAEVAFSDFQYMLYRHGRFYIEALFWANGTTSIHDHAFSGAFFLLHGSSINCEYHFIESERLNQSMRIGELYLTGCRVLQAGDVVHIRSGRRLIHSVFHLEIPSVTLVARTVQDDEAMPQFDYCGRAIGYKRDMTIGEAKAIQALRMQLVIDPVKFLSKIKRALHQSSRDQRFWIFRSLFSEISSLDLHGRQEIYAELQEDKEVFKDSLIKESRAYKATRLRQSVRDSAARLLLAALANSTNDEEFLSLCRVCLPQGISQSASALFDELQLAPDLKTFTKYSWQSIWCILDSHFV
jgi:hypothetical protein